MCAKNVKFYFSKKRVLKLCEEAVSWEKTKSCFECESEAYAINNRYGKNALQYEIICTF